MALSDMYLLSNVQVADTERQEQHTTNQQQQSQAHHHSITGVQASHQFTDETTNSIVTVTNNPLLQPEQTLFTNETTTTGTPVGEADQSGTKQIAKKRKNVKKEEDKSSDSVTRFKWTKELMQVAMNLLKYGCKPKIISVAVGCSIRTAQKFVETVTPRGEGESYKEYQVRRRGRKLKDTNNRLDAIRDVLNKDSTKTQVEIAANLKVSNTTVCRDLKKIGGTWRDKKVRQHQQEGPISNSGDIDCNQLLTNTLIQQGNCGHQTSVDQIH